MLVAFATPLLLAVLSRWVGGSIEDLRQRLNSWLPSEEEAFGVVAIVPEIPESLGPLPYGLNALEPQVGAETMRQHHDVLEPRYLANLHTELARDAPDWSKVMVNANAVILHELYWASLRPGKLSGDSAPEGALADRILRDFGSLSGLRDQFMKTSMAVIGSGWLILAWSPSLRQLVLVPVLQHSEGGLWGAVPLLVIDLWEHAWFLDRGGHKQAYLDAIWGRLDWGAAGSRFVRAVRTNDDFFEGLLG